MTKTTNYQLNQWDAADPIRREDFNADNQKIDTALGAVAESLAQKGNCRIITGTYKGTGTSGEDGPCTLTFERPPILLFVCQVFQFWAMKGVDRASSHCGNYHQDLRVTWSGNRVSWYGTGGSQSQLNNKGETHSYIALLEEK